jgi:molybdopterin converting factor small subunit
MQVHARFFAAAKQAAGAADADYTIANGSTIADLLAAVEPATDDAARVFARCSFIVDGVSTTDAASGLTDGARVDVLPPFAGG